MIYLIQTDAVNRKALKSSGIYFPNSSSLSETHAPSDLLTRLESTTVSSHSIFIDFHK